MSQFQSGRSKGMKVDPLKRPPSFVPSTIQLKPYELDSHWIPLFDFRAVHFRIHFRIHFRVHFRRTF